MWIYHFPIKLLVVKILANGPKTFGGHKRRFIEPHDKINFIKIGALTKMETERWQ